jgi:hypothetical protein
MTHAITPAEIEQRLKYLSKEVDSAQTDANDAEHQYYTAKAGYEIGIAQARMQVASKYAERGVKATVQDKEDEALLGTSDLMVALYTAEAVVRAARGNVQRLRTQVDISRTVSASVRSSMELS